METITATKWSADHLPQLPVFLENLILKAKSDLDLQKLVVFGSRARGDHHPKSDYDLCFYLESSKGWAKFCSEDIETLLSVDMVSYSEVDPQFKAEIDNTGVSIYEQPKA